MYLGRWRSRGAPAIPCQTGKRIFGKNLRDHVHAIMGTPTQEAHVTRRCGPLSTLQSLASLEVQYVNTYIYATTFPFQLFLIQPTRSESKGEDTENAA
jgi:hypothetical protein